MKCKLTLLFSFYLQVTNNLQKKLDKVRKEKADLQKALDAEKAEQDQLEKKAAEVSKKAEEVPLAAQPTKQPNNLNDGLGALTEDQEEEGEDDPNWYIDNLPERELGADCDT